MIKRKVEHYELSEYSKKEECKFLDFIVKKMKTEIEEIEHTAEDGIIFYKEIKYTFLVSDKIYNAGGCYLGYVNGKYQEFNIYY